MNEKKKRMIGSTNYEVVEDIPVFGQGSTSHILIGVDLKNKETPYVVTTSIRNELFERFENAVASDNYNEIMVLAAERIKEIAQESALKFERLDSDKKNIIYEEDCNPIHYDDCIVGKVVAINYNSMAYGTICAQNQLFYVIGGFGAESNSRGRAVFMEELASHKQSRWDRTDIMGYPKKLPQWAKDELEIIKVREEKALRDLNNQVEIDSEEMEI